MFRSGTDEKELRAVLSYSGRAQVSSFLRSSFLMPNRYPLRTVKWPGGGGVGGGGGGAGGGGGGGGGCEADL